MVSDKINVRHIISHVKPYSIYLFIVWAVIIMTASSIPSLPTLRIRAGEFSLRLDYLTHAAIYAVLAFLGYLSFSNRSLILKPPRLLLVTLSLIVFASVDEFHQKYIPGRTFNPIDLISNITGIIIVLVFCFRIFMTGDKKTG